MEDDTNIYKDFETRSVPNAIATIIYYLPQITVIVTKLFCEKGSYTHI